MMITWWIALEVMCFRANNPMSMQLQCMYGFTVPIQHHGREQSWSLTSLTGQPGHLPGNLLFFMQKEQE